MSTREVMIPTSKHFCDICGKEIEGVTWTSACGYILSYKNEDYALDLDICPDCKKKYENLIKGELRAKLVEVFKKLKEKHDAE